MKREDIEKKYNELVKSIETKIMYDGRGKVDRYTCDPIHNKMHTMWRYKVS